jgi:hypothetical protein
VLYSLQDHHGIGTCDLDHPIITGAENTVSWRARKRDLQRTFPLDVLMVTSPKLSFVASGSNPTGISLALSKTIRSGRLEFTADRLGRLRWCLFPAFHHFY